MTEKTDEKCDKCGLPMVIKWGRYGKFLACSGYPDCRNTRQLAGGEGTEGDGRPGTRHGSQVLDAGSAHAGGEGCQRGAGLGGGHEETGRLVVLLVVVLLSSLHHAALGALGHRGDAAIHLGHRGSGPVGALAQIQDVAGHRTEGDGVVPLPLELVQDRRENQPRVGAAAGEQLIPLEIAFGLLLMSLWRALHSRYVPRV